MSKMLNAFFFAPGHHEHKARHSGQSVAVTETTNPGSSDAYQELSTMSRTEPVYNQLARQ